MFNPSGGKHVTAAAEGGGKSATRTGRTVQLALAHLIDVSALERAYGRSRKAAAVGVDGVTKEEYDRDAVKEAAQYERDRELEQWDRDLLEEREAMAERLEGRSLGQCCEQETLQLRASRSSRISFVRTSSWNGFFNSFKPSSRIPCCVSTSSE